MKTSGLFYRSLGIADAAAIKTAAIYFDETFLLTPITLIDGDAESDYHARLRKWLYQEFGEALGLQVPENEEVSAGSAGSLYLQHEVRSLVKEGVVKVVNPFDELGKIGLRQQLKEVMLDASALTARLKREKANDRTVSTMWTARGAIHSAWSGGYHERRAGKGLKADKMYTLQISEDVLQKVMTESAIVISKMHNLVPISVDEYSDSRFWRNISYKVSNLSADVKEYYRQLYQEKRRDIDGYRILQRTVLEELPRFRLTSFEDVLKVRSNYSDELIALRTQLCSLSKTIASEGTRDDLDSAITTIIRLHINPAIIDLRRKIECSKDKFFQRFVEKAITAPTAVSVAATVHMGLPIHYTPLIAAGIGGILALCETSRELKDLRTSSPFSFLLRL